MKKMVLAISILLLATSAMAQLDPDDDGIGVYFDPCACNNCATMGGGPQTAFLVITHPTSPDGVAGWEAKLTLEGPALISGVALQGQAVNAGTGDDFVVGVVEPLVNPYTFPAIVVAVINFFVIDTGQPSMFFIDGVNRHSLDTKVPAYLDGADISLIKELQQSTGGPTFPVATINGDCAVATENETWGGVKALFR